ncbi:hypothetical protein KEM55_004832 [Ascosphaera atra]|nr:hypothetical protein KEM55_004832 [Ascosphaera atra]
MPELASQARLVGRDELLPSRTPSPEPVDPEASTYAAAAFQQLFGSIETVDAFAQPSNTADAANQGEEEEEQEYEFRLFRDQPAPEKSDAVESGDKKESEGVQKLRIRLRSPSPGAEGPGGFTVPFRGWDYYFSRPNDILQGTSHQSELPAGTLEVYAKRHSEYTDIAVTAEDVLDFSKEQKVCITTLPLLEHQLTSRTAWLPSFLARRSLKAIFRQDSFFDDSAAA